VLVTCPDLKAESRFAASICSRLAQLGAISMADRRSGAGCVDFGDSAALVGQYSNKAAETVANANKIPLGSSPTSIKLLNRCLAMPPEKGNEIVGKLMVAIAKQQSQNAGRNARVKELKVEGKFGERESFTRLLPDGVRGTSMVKTYQTDNGVTFEEACAKLDEDTAFYVRRVEDASFVSPIVLAVKRVSSTLLIRPNGTKTSLNGDAFERAYERCSVDDATTRERWEEWLEASKTDDSRYHFTRILTLPFLDHITSRFCNKVQLVRVQNGSETLLGMRIDRHAVEALRRQKLADAMAAGAGSSTDAV
jgi:hypothetical protein